DLKGSWDSSYAASGSVVELTTERAHSGTTSLRTTFGPAIASGSVTRQLTTVAKRAKMTFWLYVDVAAYRGINIGALEFRYTGGRTDSVYFILANNQMTAVELEFVGSTQTYFQTHATKPLITGRWTELVVDVDLVNAKASWSYDGQPMITNEPL